MERKHLRFDQLFDIRAMRIIVDSVEHCYEVLSIVQEHFTIIEKEYDDYIAHPKPNGYQSLHTVMRDPEGKPVEIQIRTRAMHEFAELGVAAHWHYKEAGNSNKDKAAEALKFTSQYLLRFGVVDDVVEEPLGGAHRDHRMMALNLKKYIRAKLRELTKIPLDQLVEERYRRFRNLGVYLEEAVEAAVENPDPKEVAKSERGE